MFASVGPNLPHDLFAATGDYAGPLGWTIDRPMPAADRWLESKFPLWARSIIEDWAAGAFGHLDSIVFSRADDAAQRLYYYACELRRRGMIAGPEPLILDIAKIARASSVERTVAALRALAARLGVDDAMLRRGIEATNARRGGASPAIAAAGQARICLIEGTPPPDRRLHALVEQVHWAAIGETLLERWSALGPAVALDAGDPVVALGRQLHAGALGVRAFFDRGAALVARARAIGAGAVILWLAEEDDADVWHLPGQLEALAVAAIPTLSLTRADWRAGDGVDRRIATFLEEVGQ